MAEVTDRPSAFIVKLGGSLITHKDGYCESNVDAIRDFGCAVAAAWPQVRGRLVVVLGGGSYGSGVVTRYGLRNSSDTWKPTDLGRMTMKMFDLLTTVASLWREEGVACFPFQTAAWVVASDRHRLNGFVEPILRVMTLGVVPLLSGDLVFDERSGFMICSSDRVPELLARHVPIRRVVMLTDVPGVFDLTNQHEGEPSVLRTVNRENASRALAASGASKKVDVTGGMRNKVDAALRLAQLGVESVICDGRDPQVFREALLAPMPPGTIFEPWAVHHHDSKARASC